MRGLGVGSLSSNSNSSSRMNGSEKLGMRMRTD